MIGARNGSVAKAIKGCAGEIVSDIHFATARSDVFVRGPVFDPHRCEFRADGLPQIDGPGIVCAQAGNVNSGAFDPFAELAEWAHASGGWLHIDGAFGLWAVASDAHRHLCRGVELADSWATDAHKWLNVPYDSGLAFVRNADALRAAMSFGAAYLPVDGMREPFHTTAEALRRGRGVEIWAALRSLGHAGVEDLIDRCCALAQRFERGLREAGHEVLNDVVLNQVVVSFGDEARTRATIRAVQEEGVCWCGPTQWRGRVAMRRQPRSRRLLLVQPLDSRPWVRRR